MNELNCAGGSGFTMHQKTAEVEADSDPVSQVEMILYDCSPGLMSIQQCCRGSVRCANLFSPNLEPEPRDFFEPRTCTSGLGLEVQVQRCPRFEPGSI